MTPRKLKSAIIVLVVMFAFASGAFAVAGKNRHIEGEEILKGDMKELAATTKGVLCLTVKLDKVESEPLSLWCSASDGKGAVYFGTGLKAAIYKLAEGKLAKIDLGENYSADMIVTTMTCDAAGNLYAAVLPTGRIIKITPDGKAAEFANLPEFYIWKIIFDKNGDLFVATGPAGRIYKVSADGATKKVVYDSEEDNVVSLVFNDGGDLYFGTSPGAILMKIPAAELAKEKPAAAVVYDFPMTDVCTMYFQNGLLYVGVNKIGGGGSYDYSSEMGEGIESGGEKAVEPSFKGYEGGAVFLVDARGDIEPIFSSPNSVSQLRIAGDLVFIAVTGQNKIFQYDTKKREASSFGIKEKQAQTFELINGRLDVIGTSDPGVVYRVGDRPVEEGVYTSEVIDAGVDVKAWGILKWEGDGALVFQTRSGNTEKPGSTWSDWSEALKTSPAAIKSPVGRFVQFRVTWAQKDATLKSVDVSFLPRNSRPIIMEVKVGAPPEEERGSRYVPLRDADEKKAGLPISWKAVDPNGDALEFDLFYKEESETAWKKVNTFGPISGNGGALNPELVPSGKYRFKLVASDRPANPQDEILEAEMISDVFVIDHDGPAVAKPAAQTVKQELAVVTAQATDDISNIEKVEYALDGQAWKAGTCEDGIFDSLTETVKVFLEGIKPGEHTIVLRVYDAAGNMSTTHLTFTVPQQ
jgi:YD repeat-containing protein